MRQNALVSDKMVLTTPRGHEVQLELDYSRFALCHAKVVNHYTGVIRALDEETSEMLLRALKAKQVYEEALSQTREVEETLKRFGKLAEALGNDHPALKPYWREAQQHKSVARDMYSKAQNYHEEAMRAIDKMAE